MIIPPSPSPIRLSVVLTISQHHMQRVIVIPPGSQHERLAVPIRKQRHTCMSTSATQQVGLQGMLRDAACCLLLAACSLLVGGGGPYRLVRSRHMVGRLVVEALCHDPGGASREALQVQRWERVRVLSWSTGTGGSSANYLGTDYCSSNVSGVSAWLWLFLVATCGYLWLAAAVGGPLKGAEGAN